VERMLRAHHFPADLYMIARSRLSAEISANPAIDRDSASCDQFITVPARTNARGGKEAVQAHSSGPRWFRNHPPRS